MSQEEAEQQKPKEQKHTRCNFCSKDVSQVFTLITGPGVNICDECVIQSVGIVTKEINRREAKLNKVVSFEEKKEKT
jgi:ATP-dependent protease Clp ATPase subunit